jgi:uncharacterized protein (DUF1697 family)
VQTYVALLRGINLGARNKIAMGDLRAMFETLDARDVRTYVQSGNVVFVSDAKAADLPDAIERAIARAAGLDVEVLVRTRAQLDRVVKGNPFADGAELKALHVTFLDARPAKARVDALDPERYPPDTFRVAGQEVYLHCPNGYGPSKLSNAYFEKQLGVAATTRNWRTVTTLAAMASGQS